MALDLEVNEVEVKGLTSLASVTEITAEVLELSLRCRRSILLVLPRVLEICPLLLRIQDKTYDILY
jgi:hypothetical protein